MCYIDTFLPFCDIMKWKLKKINQRKSAKITTLRKSLIWLVDFGATFSSAKMVIQTSHAERRRLQRNLATRWFLFTCRHPTQLWEKSKIHASYNIRKYIWRNCYCVGHDWHIPTVMATTPLWISKMNGFQITQTGIDN